MAFVKGGIDTLNTMLFGGPTAEIQEVIKNKWEHTRNFIADTSQQFLNKTHEMVTAATDINLVYAARDLLYRYGNTNDQNSIVRYDPAEIKSANVINQEYLMAYPSLYARYRKKELSAYNGTYRPLYRVDTPEDNPIYKTVMSNMNSSLVEDGFFIYQTTLPIKTLENHEKFAVMSNWKLAKLALLEEIDITEL